MRLAVEGLVTAGLCLALLCDGALAQSRRPEQISPATPRAEGGNGGGGTGIGACGGIGGGS